MSPYDVTRLTPSVPTRDVNAGHDRNAIRQDSSVQQAPADKGIAVTTDAKISAGSPSVDTDRVSEIRQALRDGSYPIVPAKITDAMIAARLMLRGGK